MRWCKVVVTLVLLSVYMCSLRTAATRFWQREGCHLVGVSKTATLSGCHQVRFPVNACVGYCQSYSELAPFGDLNGRLFNSGGSCCSIQDTHEVIVNLPCENNIVRQLTYRSAASCTCSLCSIGES